MSTGRRALLLAIAGLSIGAAGSFAQQPESRSAAEKEADALIEAVEHLMVSEPENYSKILDALNAIERKVARFPAKKNKIQSYQSEWIGKRDAARSKKANIELIELLEQEVHDPAKFDSVRIKLDSARRAASSLAQAGFKEWVARVEKIASTLRVNTLRGALDAAKAKEATGNLTEALAACDEAVAKFNKEVDGPARVDKPIIDLYKELIAYSDSLVEKVETPEFEAKTPERDFLSQAERRFWGTSKGSTLNWSPSSVTIEGVPIDQGKVIGVASVLPAKTAPWHDLVIDLEFTLLSGEMEMYVRYWPDKKSYLIRFAPAHGYELNKAYRMTIRVKGSQISLKQPDQPENRDRFVADTSRTGGVGFGVTTGSKVEISKLNVKVLR